MFFLRAAPPLRKEWEEIIIFKSSSTFEKGMGAFFKTNTTLR